MKKVLWLSRHEMTPEQVANLKAAEGFSDAEIVRGKIAWHVSESEEADDEANADEWKRLASAGYDVVVGVFPPVAITGLVLARSIADGAEGEADASFECVNGIEVLTPVSVSGTFRDEATGTIRKSFVFKRWQHL